jgi:hypothetical protein
VGCLTRRGRIGIDLANDQGGHKLLTERGGMAQIRPICGFDATFHFLEEDLEKYKIMAGRVEAAAADEKAA